MNPVVLAYMGDCVHTLYVRQKLAFSSDAKSGELNKREAKIVCATAQAHALNNILPLLTEEEHAIFRRARNSKKNSRAKTATLTEYAKSTGFEAVIGYLYVTNQTDRLNELLFKAENTSEGE